MPHSLVRAYIHYVWTTKNRERTLVNEARYKLRTHIAEYATHNGIDTLALNVQPEHVHLLVSLSRSQRIEDVIKLIKGESSHWINSSDLLPGKFAWQTGYWAGSVSYRHREAVVSYINGQDEHHRRKSFAEEFQEVLTEYGYSAAEVADFLRLESQSH